MGIFTEIKKQLTDTPSFVGRKAPVRLMHTERLDATNRELEQALRENSAGLIFLIGPYGSGKTTQLDYFLKDHPEYDVNYKSFEKIESLDFAYLHLTSFITRAIFLLIAFVLAILFIQELPPAGALPIMLVAIYFFVKNVAALMYIFHETVSNLFSPKPKLIVIEDLERSSLATSAQWVFFANLWQYKRTYIISLGYPIDEIHEKQKIVENVMKLSGSIIDLVNDERVNLDIITALDKKFSSFFAPKMGSEVLGWLELFTPREMIIIDDEMKRANPQSDRKTYISIFLKYLLQKLHITPNEVTFDAAKNKIKILSEKKLPSEQEHYLHSFELSLCTAK